MAGLCCVGDCLNSLPAILILYLKLNAPATFPSRAGRSFAGNQGGIEVTRILRLLIHRIFLLAPHGYHVHLVAICFRAFGHLLLPDFYVALSD